MRIHECKHCSADHLGELLELEAEHAKLKALVEDRTKDCGKAWLQLDKETDELEAENAQLKAQVEELIDAIRHGPAYLEKYEAYILNAPRCHHS